MERISVTRLLLAGLFCAGCVGAGVLPAVWADDAMIDQADAMTSKGDYEGAITLLKRAQLDDAGAGSSYASEKLVALYVKLKRYDDATPLLQEMYSKTRDKRYARWLADTYQLAGNFYGAQRAYEELVAADGNDERSMYHLAKCLDATGNYDAARDMYRRVAEKGGEYAESAQAALARAENESPVTSIDPDTEIGRWPKDRMPLKIFIGEGNGIAGYRPQLRTYAVQAMQDWQNASHRLLTFVQVPDAKGADIAITFVSSISGALGITRPISDEYGYITKATVQIAANVDSGGKPLPQESPATRALYDSRDGVFREVVLHEFGHALGLHHSPRNTDVMAAGGYGFHTSQQISERGLQPGDIERITQLYSIPEPQKDANSKAALAAALQKIVAKFNAAGGDSEPTVAAGTSTMRGGNPYEKSAAVKPNVPDPHTTAMQQAIFALQGGKFADCVEILKDVLKMNPRNAQAHYIMAVACVNMRNYGEAQKEYEQVLKLAPTGKLAELASAGLSKIKK